MLRNFRKNESVNLIRVKQTANQNTLQEAQNEKTAEAINKAEKDFSADLRLLVDETARDTKLLDVIIALETDQPDSIFYPNRSHRKHLFTRFGLLFYNDKIVIPKAMRSTLIVLLHQGHVSINKMDQSAEAFWWPGIHGEIREKAENCTSCRAAGKNLRTQLPHTEINTLEILDVPNQEIQLYFVGPIKSLNMQ